MSYIIEMGQYPCKTCGEILWAWPRTPEEIDNMICNACIKPVAEITNDEPITLPNPTEGEIQPEGGTTSEEALEEGEKE